MAKNYWVFRRAARKAENLRGAPKVHVCHTDTIEEARATVERLNTNRTRRQRIDGVRFDFMWVGDPVVYRRSSKPWMNEERPGPE